MKIIQFVGEVADSQVFEGTAPNHAPGVIARTKDGPRVEVFRFTRTMYSSIAINHPELGQQRIVAGDDVANSLIDCVRDQAEHMSLQSAQISQLIDQVSCKNKGLSILHNEVAELKVKINNYETMSFWNRVKFLFK